MREVMKEGLKGVGMVMLAVLGICVGIFFFVTAFALLGPYTKWLEHLIGVR